MGTILSSLLGSATSALGGIWIYVVVGIAAGAAGAYGGYRWELGVYETRVAEDAQAQVLAVSKAKDALAKSDAISLNSAVTEAAAQTKIVTETQTITKEVQIHVPEIHACVPVGLIRVLNAAAYAGPGSLSDAAGQSDDACAPVSWRAFAAELVDDYGAGQANAEQLTALQDWAKNQAANLPPN